MKTFCKKENKFVFIHPGKKEVANFDFHLCFDCSCECNFSSYRMLPYVAFVQYLRWVAQSPVDYICYDYGYLSERGKWRRLSDDEWRLVKLTYSLPSFIGGKMWNKFSKVCSKMNFYVARYHKFILPCSDELIKLFVQLKENLRIRLLNEAVNEAKQFKHYDPTKPHWVNEKLQKEIKRKGIEYEA